MYTVDALNLPVALLGQSMATTVPRDSFCSHPDWPSLPPSSHVHFLQHRTESRRVLVWEIPAHLGLWTGSSATASPTGKGGKGREKLRMRRLYLDLPIAGWGRDV